MLGFGCRSGFHSQHLSEITKLMLHLSLLPDKLGFKATEAWGNRFADVLYTYRPSGAMDWASRFESCDRREYPTCGHVYSDRLGNLSPRVNLSGRRRDQRRWDVVGFHGFPFNPTYVLLRIPIIVINAVICSGTDSVPTFILSYPM